MVGRLTIIDGFRGFFLLLMAQHHVNGVLGSIVGKINYAYFGWVDVAQGFVFISGLVIGLVYGRRYLSAPTIRAIYRPVLRRVRTIYLHQATLMLMLLVAALAFGPLAGEELRPYVDVPVAFTVSSLPLLSASAHIGILPM